MRQAGRKVLVISGAFPPLPVAESDHVLHLCRGLQERGLEVEVLTKQGSASGADLPFRVRPVMLHWNWFEFPRLLKAARECSPDVIFLFFGGHLYNFHPMVTLVPAIFRRVLRDVTVVTQLTCTIGSRPFLQSFVTRLTWKALLSIPRTPKIDYSYGALLEDSDRIIVMANSHLQEFARISPQVRAKSILIPPPPLLPMSAPGPGSRKRGRQALGLAEEDFVFAYFGRLRGGKGLDTLLEAFQRVAARHPKVRLAMIGGADQDWFRDGWTPDYLHDLARTLGVDDKVVWTGEYPWDSDLGSAYLRAVDVAVLPFDAGVDLNNSSFAAVAAHGLPTITTRGAAMEEAFVDAENVFVCPPRDPAATAAAMERLLADGELRQRLRSGIETLAKDWFSWDGSIERTIEAFNTPRVAARGAPAANLEAQHE